MEHFTCLYFCKTLPDDRKQHLSTKIWSNSETTLLNLVAPGHANDICNLSSCFPLKNCLNVFLKMLEVGLLEKIFENESLENMKPVIDSFEDLKLQPEIIESAIRFEYKPGVFFNKRDEVCFPLLIAKLNLYLFESNQEIPEPLVFCPVFP